MKQLFSALLILISINCFSQTTGFFRYDTVRIQKVGANSTLIIENATRDSLGFLYNYGGGRTKFEVIRAVPGGIKVGNDTIIVDQSDLSDRLISGGQVTYSGTGLKFYISPAVYVIDEVIYTTDYDSVTLSASDPADPRKDVIYLATTGVEVLEGTPAGPAAEPQLDAGQIKLTVVDVPAGATTPGLTQNIIWDENTESVVTNVGTTTDPDNLTNVYHLTKSINVTNVNTGDIIWLTLPSTINLNAYHGISLFLKLKAVMSPSAGITLTFFNGSTQVSNELGLGFTWSLVNYQGVSRALSGYTFSNTFADKIRIRVSGVSAVHTGFYLDYVYLQSGLIQGGGSSDPLTIGPIDTKTSSPNGAVIENNILYNQTASQTNPGLLSPADKTKLDSLHSDYFIENEGDGEELATQVNDSTIGIKSLKAGTNVTLDVTDTTITINSTGGGGSEGFEDVIINDNVITADRSVQLGPSNALVWAAVNPGVDSVIQRHTGGLWYVQWDAGITANTGFYLSPTIVQMQAYNGGTNHGGRFTIDGFDVMDGAVYTDFDGTPTGIKYAGDYSASFVNRSLVDKEYVDNVAGAGISLTTTGSSGVATLVGTVLNVPDYSSGASIWNGVVIGTTFSATGATINSGAVQWTFTGSSPATFTLPARTSSVNQFYTIKNTGSADLTVAAAGTDDIFTTSSVSSLVVTANGGSVMITGAANGTSDLWTALFHTAGVPNLIVADDGTAGEAIWRASGDSLYLSRITAGANITVTKLPTGENEISAAGGGSGTVSTGVSGALAYYPSAGTTVDDIIGTANQIAGMNSGATAPEFKSLATGTSGTNFNIAHSANTVTFNIPDASGTATGLITATTQTIGGTKTFSGSVNIPNLTVTSVFSQNASGPNSILYMPTAVASGTANTAALLFEGAALVRARAFSNGSTAMAMAANESGANWIFGGATTTEAASGTHAGIFGIQINAPIINTGAGATTEAATLNVDGPPTGTAAITNPIHSLRVRTGNVLFGNGNLSLATAGNKLFIAEGSNSSVGRSGAMTAGSITISTTAVTANSIIQLTPVGAGTGQISIGTITAGTSFVINSSDGADTRIVHWTIIN